MCRRRLIMLGIVLASGCTGNYTGGLAPGVSVERVLALKVGMSYEQVVAVLGPPVEVKRVAAGSELERLPNGSRESVVLSYGRPVIWAASYPLLWVRLDDNRLESVYAKQGFFGGTGDDGLYLYDKTGVVKGDNLEFRQVFGR